MSSPHMDQQPPPCTGCRRFIEEGSVIAFGDSLFHLECFVCAKCSTAVDCSSNLLLLTDGRPVCENCSYVCTACKQSIRDEAVMTGEEAYHANCFRCVACRQKIEDLVFTQTSKGIYCSSCHEQRRADRQRRREEKERRQQQLQQSLPSPQSASSRADQPMVNSPAPSASQPGMHHGHNNAAQRHTSRMLDSQVVADYLQIQQALDGQVRTKNETSRRFSPATSSSSYSSSTNNNNNNNNNSYSNGNLNTHYDKHPPTPTRSRSSSVDTMGRNKLSRGSEKAPTPPPSAGSQSPSIPPGITRLSSIPSANSSEVSLHNSSNPAKDNIYLLKDGSVSKGNLSNQSSSSSLSQALPDLPSFNLSFFDNDSSDLVNLTRSLGANLEVGSTTSLHINGNYGNNNNNNNNNKQPKLKSKASFASSKISKASELLASSLRQASHGGSSSALSDFPQPPTGKSVSTNATASPFVSSFDLDSDEVPTDRASVLRMKAELKSANLKLTELNGNLSRIKDASKRALDEFTRAKEEIVKEANLRQQHEYTIMQLRHQLAAFQQAKMLGTEEFSAASKEEVERVARIRVELERTCKELNSYRENIARDIENLSKQKQAGLVDAVSSTSHLEQQQKALAAHIESLVAERDSLKSEAEELGRIRDEVLNEMVVLNTKNAELSSMNNDLSRRMTEREREAAAVMAGTSFLYPTASTSNELPTVGRQRKSSEASLDTRKVAARDSFSGATSAPKLFKMKKGANVFQRFGYKSNKVADPSVAEDENQTGSPYKLANASSSSMSLATSYEPIRREREQSQGSSVGNGTHSFQPTPFLRPVKCNVCSEKMWGLSEYRCQGCGVAAHGKCLSHVSQVCFGSTSSSLDLLSPADSESSHRLDTMFGADLAGQVALEGRSIPLIVEKCIEAVEVRAMDMEGIYRKSGGAAQMRAIQVAFDQGVTIDLTDDDEYNDIGAVTSVLKHYFRELPNPLLTFELYAKFIEAVSMPIGTSKTNRFIEILSQLPQANYDTLKMLMNHLYRVSQRSSENRMTVKNLALVFGPTLMRDTDSNRDFLDMSYKNATMEYLILNSKELFAVN